MRKVISLLMLFFLLGCTRLNMTAAPALATPQPAFAPGTLAPFDGLRAPAETLPAVTAIPLPEQTPTLEAATATPILLTIPPTSLDFPTITPSPTLDVSSHIQLRIVVPGPMSKVVSPIQFVVHIDPYYTGLTRIELVGEDGRELYRKVFKTRSNIGYFTRVEEKVTFELKGAAEMGRLQISTYDTKGNMLALNSLRLMLFSVGENQFSPSYLERERVALRSPKNGDEITGGAVSIEGEINPINDTPVILELFDADGHIIGSRLLQLVPADGKYQPFATTIPYQVDNRLPVRLNIRQSDDRISGLAYLFSLPLFVNP